MDVWFPLSSVSACSTQLRGRDSAQDFNAESQAGES